MQELLTEIHALSEQKAILENTLNDLKNQIAALDIELNNHRSELEMQLKISGINEIEYDNVVAFIQTRNTTGYKSESDIIRILKESRDSQYIKTKVSESIDKNALKKALKTDSELTELLDPYIQKGTSDVLIVTTVENKIKMLEHINESNS